MASAAGKGQWLSRMIRQWTVSFCEDHTWVPLAQYGKFNSSILEDEDIADDIRLHLQSLGKWIRAEDIVHYVDTPEFRARLKVKKNISVRTAERWLKRMGYTWRNELKGQYANGHERQDNVCYRQDEFLPKWMLYEARTRWWKADGSEDGNTMERILVADPNGKIVLRWVHSSETAKPYAKGEGASLMVADFVLPDHALLKARQMKDEKGQLKHARVLFQPGKTRDGYQTTQNILDQATIAMDILDADYPDEQHVFAYDNATIHTARSPDALSATAMPCNPNASFFCKVMGKDGEVEKRVKMKNGTFRDGSSQELYYPADHPDYPGHFKGTRVLIQERREKGHELPDPYEPKKPGGKLFKLKGSCKKCPTDSRNCCCRRVLYFEQDFVDQKSMLEEHCERQAYQIIFFPKYHCELSFIEQCWGYAKNVYRMFPTSSSEADLEENTLKALDSVPLVSMRRFATRSSRFAHSYFSRLNGAEAAWANKKYRGHRTIPPDFRAEMEAHFKKNRPRE
ncbi:hypothetical protein GGU10DRAFT_397774 [Lentinula aff. detonsa]|uniref:Uncharacterized protein n=1 Tax=Lentinula aff. detonsa TaxID=2804958 RepID=A0AA38KBR2_9AGAR|nr:hypothetical protein GGU10DRAFT_397774 [Lentinula aff. detonsa]